MNDRNLDYNELQNLVLSNNDLSADAMRKSDEIAKKYPEDTEILNFIGILYTKNKLYDKALDVFHTINNINPNQYNICVNIGNLHRLMKHYSNAEDFLTQAVSIDSQQFQAHYNLALLYVSIKISEKAKQSYRLAIENIPQEQVTQAILINNEFIHFLIKSGQLQNAKQIADKCMNKYPTSPIFFHKAGNLAAMGKDFKLAASYYEKALEINPNDKDIKYNLFFALKEIGKLNEAISLIKDLNHRDSKAYYIDLLFRAERKEEFYGALNEATLSFKGSRLLANLSKLASYKYKSEDRYPFCLSPLDFIYKSNAESIDNKYLGIIEKLNWILNSTDMEYVKQDLLEYGEQSAGNLFARNEEGIEQMKDLIEDHLKLYREKFDDNDEYFIESWPGETYLSGWFIKIKNGGSLGAHYHHNGWISGSIYLNIPSESKVDEGAIEFGYNSDNYKEVKGTPTVSIKPEMGDIILFPSSLGHRVTPFLTNRKKEERTSIAFDLIPKI